MNNKNNFYIVVAVLLVLVVGFYLFSQNKITKAPIEQVQNSQNELPAPEIPKFIAGSVSRVEGNKVFITVDNEEKTIMTDEKTDITKQVKEGIESLSISAKFSEIKSPREVIVHYNSNSGSEYQASKIHILE